MSEQPMWVPSRERVERTHMHAFTARLRDRYGQRFPDYWSLWRWSLANKEVFWREFWDYAGVRGDIGERALVDGHLMPGARWFPDARVSFAENMLRRQDASEALVFWNESGARRRISAAALADEVGRLAGALRMRGVVTGDRVASLLPNVPEAVSAMLATASLGAVWSSASPDFGVEGVLDRFAQIEPVVLFAVNGYVYGGKRIDVRARVLDIVRRLPALRAVVWLDYVAELPLPDDAPHVAWAQFAAEGASASLSAPSRLAFDHPLLIAYSSGTTGLPKGIVHGAGGTLLQQMKEHQLHCDIHALDRVFYFSTTGWVMWNWLLAALASEATLLLYDGSPLAEGGRILWDFAQAERCTLFGTSARYIAAIKKAGVVPRRTHELPELRTVLSTGAPLAPESFDYIYQCVKPDVHLASISGGTDIMACFAIGNPTLPVWRGELQCRSLAMAVDVFDEAGRSIEGEMGELVCTQSFPSMPLGFIDDTEGARYRATYFERYRGVWHHGDWCQLTTHDGMLITGRSDATLNPGGVRIGTAEIYRRVERIPEVVECVAIGQHYRDDVRVVLFVVLEAGRELDAALSERIRREIAEHTTPRHVPAKIVQVPDIARTRSNKLAELAVRDVVHGRNPKNVEALANPEALEFFRNRPELAQD
ncbi:MAG: acetoacetate--CoA ligase [Burkholderiales bacterium]|nr:acetoacetate--CoA ligase [Burkholderiales bacterium]